ncbi:MULTISPECIES: hypothetical protein [unclassified Bradyrhizobium]
MLTTEQIRKVAAQSGARDIEKVEIDITPAQPKTETPKDWKISTKL